MGEPLVSVVVIFLDAGRFIDEAIESVFQQTYRSWELLLVDDGSTDGSTEIALGWAQRHPHRVRYLEHPGHANRGMSASRNLGIANARGDYIGLLDADDVWLPQKLERQLELMRLHPEAALLCGAYEYWHSWTGNAEDEDADFVVHPAGVADAVVQPPALVTRCYPLGRHPAPTTHSLLFRRDLVDQIGGFEESFKGPFEDLVFLTKVYLNEPVFVSTDCCSRYRVHPDSGSAAVMKTGLYYDSRLTFLRWLEDYLRTQRRTDDEIWRAYERAVEPYWEHRRPVSYRLYPLVHRVLARPWDRWAERRLLRARSPVVAREAAAAHEPEYEGFHDLADCKEIRGWAWNKNRQDLAVDIDIYDGGRLVARVTADEYRLDLQKAGKGSGHHGFCYWMPPKFRDGKPHVMRAKVAGTDIALTSTPKTIRCEMPIVADVKALGGRLRRGSGRGLVRPEHLESQGGRDLQDPGPVQNLPL